MRYLCVLRDFSFPVGLVARTRLPLVHVLRIEVPYSDVCLRNKLVTYQDAGVVAREGIHAPHHGLCVLDARGLIRLLLGAKMSGYAKTTRLFRNRTTNFSDLLQ